MKAVIYQVSGIYSSFGAQKVYFVVKYGDKIVSEFKISGVVLPDVRLRQVFTHRQFENFLNGCIL